MAPQWAEMEALGFESIWTNDHFHGLIGPLDGVAFEAQTTLTAIAMSTERVRFGSMTYGVTHRNPAILAKQMVTLDHLSGGRAVLGLGAGWYEEEHAAYAIPFPPAGDRVSMLLEALRILPPAEYLGAVETIPLVVELVQQLQHAGHAYQVEDDWYFEVHSDPSFGQLAKLTDTEMLEVFGERGGDPDREGKRHPLDCLLWRAERPGEPAWDTKLGRGRPGWHIECSAIALSSLGEHFDVQGGGSDLLFPHHEMSASEAQAAFPGLLFARNYVHAGMVAYEGHKMSKSLGNLVFVSTLREQGVDPQVLRLALLAHHYRSDWEWQDDDLRQAEKRLAAWRAQLSSTTQAQADQLVVSVRQALAGDLDTPRALKLLDDWAEGWYPGDGSGADTVRDLIDARLGILL